jgi:5-(carboxyamino)imidazole ribonucleotide synthase
MSPGGVLEPPATLGVIGGGQLGRMFLLAAHRMGFRTVAMCQERDSPAAQLARKVILAGPGDPEGLGRLAASADAITVEFENISAPGLRWLERRGIVRPGWKSVWVAQNRIREKSVLARHGFPVPRWFPIRDEWELQAAVAGMGTTGILKTAASGYDGKGQIRFDDPGKIPGAWSDLGRVACVAETLVDFAAEVSCIVVRGHDGRSAAFPVCWNRHVDHILDTTLAPAPIGPRLSQEAQAIALGVADALGTVGLLAVEFFLTAAGELLVNEVAPRPHNSGHWTIEAMVTSQFEQQVRALAGLPLGVSRLLQPAAMVNLLGDLWGEREPNWRAALQADPEVAIHLYGKLTPRPGRKMGHMTVLDRDPETALARALTARRALATPH